MSVLLTESKSGRKLERESSGLIYRFAVYSPLIPLTVCCVHRGPARSWSSPGVCVL